MVWEDSVRVERAIKRFVREIDEIDDFVYGHMKETDRVLYPCRLRSTARWVSIPTRSTILGSLSRFDISHLSCGMH
jgi:hypothetical protein